MDDRLLAGAGHRASRLALPLAGLSAAGTLTALAFAAAPAPRPAAVRPTVRKPMTAAAARPVAATASAKASGVVNLSGPWSNRYHLAAGAAVEVSVHLDRPSALPANGRVGVEWVLEQPDRPGDVVSSSPRPPLPVVKAATPIAAPGIPEAPDVIPSPTANWRKVLHALDGDVYVLYRAPVAGRYTLKLAPVIEEAWVGDTAPRWREKGLAPAMFPLPARTAWPAGTTAPVSVRVASIDVGNEAQTEKIGALVETEPNDTPEQAQSLTLVPNSDVRTYEITGTADDLEYFDNGRVGQGGDDWFRVELKADAPRLVTAQLSMPGQFVAARVRCYQLAEGTNPRVPLGGLLPVSEFLGKVNRSRLPWQDGIPLVAEEGRDPNERVHQQEEKHRASITRLMEPGHVYYFRVEANAPGYQLQVRVLRPAPYTDPKMAIRQAMYTQIGQVDAWLTNRPRGASVDRRIRDTGNLLGTQCMSCHTQSGVWGPAGPIAQGYRVENRQNFWHLLNVMYECLRPTNDLKDAANNTSLATLDLGDGPAGTRAAGFNIVNAERVAAPAKLHGKQQLRTANFVLQSGDPGGINAAGPGSNVGQNIVKLFAAEILLTAWRDTGDPKYFHAAEAKAEDVSRVEPKFTDDVAVRLDFFGRVFPLKEYVANVRKVAEGEKATDTDARVAKTEAFITRVNELLVKDEARLRALQQEDGSWTFNPGTSPDGGKTWKRPSDNWDPSPTALAITGLTSRGYGKDDPSIARGVQALLRLQDPAGRWNRHAITGFVTTAYAMRALAQLYPTTPVIPTRAEFVAPPNEAPLAAIRRVQALALAADPKFTDLLLQAAKHSHPLVRYWAMIGLGATHTEVGVPALLAALREKPKPIRDAAAWALKQTLLDDRGWDQAFAAAERGDDYTREGVMQALGMRADAVLPASTVGWERLTRTLDHAMNDDPSPAVRAWASKAAWQWWIWNPPVRSGINTAWARMLERPEPNALVENNNRYSSQALFIANGHKANGSSEQQYKELAALFELLRGRLEKADPVVKSRMARRLVAVAGTFYQTAGGDGGPGQMGYITPGAGALMGQAVLVYLRETEPSKNFPAITAGLEGAANIPHGPLQEYLIDYALKGPEELRKAAAEAVSDPRSATLEAAPERVEPLIAQVRRGAAEPSRRASLSDPVIKLFGAVNWVIPKDAEQQRRFLDLMVPKLDHYQSPEQVASMSDPAKKAAAEREMDAEWYLADRMGDVLASNPDLRLDMTFRNYFPEEFSNPLERHLWVRSVPWILEYKHAAPEVVTTTPAAPAAPGEKKPLDLKADPVLVAKDRALQLYLDALRPSAPAATRAAAVRISNNTAVRRNPEVLLALNDLLKVEKDEQLRGIAENVVKQGSEKFVPELVAALKAEARPGKWLAGDKVNPEFLQDLTYFRDYIIPELARVKRNDQASCMGCHGIPGRVPSFTLRPVDQFGYLSVPDLLHDYREMQARVNLADLERSKILRKPLNVQDGKEDGHQGGRRYLPGDEGYLLLKRWVTNQPKLLQTVMAHLLWLGHPGPQMAWLQNPADRPRFFMQ